MKHFLIRGFFAALLSVFSSFAFATHSHDASYHPFTPAEQQLAQSINRTGVAVIKEGDRLTLVIPVDAYFYPASTRVKEQRKTNMKEIAALVFNYQKRFRNTTVYVSGFADRVFSRKTRVQLSQQYADVIASYLWRKGIPTERIQVKGFGADHPIASNRTPRGAAFNRRVEIMVK